MYLYHFRNYFNIYCVPKTKGKWHIYIFSIEKSVHEMMIDMMLAPIFHSRIFADHQVRLEMRHQKSCRHDTYIPNRLTPPHIYTRYNHLHSYIWALRSTLLITLTQPLSIVFISLVDLMKLCSTDLTNCTSMCVSVYNGKCVADTCSQTQRYII